MLLHSRIRIIPAILAVAVLASVPPARADDGTARDLVKKAVDAAPQVPFKAVVTLSSSRGLSRTMELSHRKMDNEQATYIEVTSPQDVAGTRFLFFERTEGRDEQYIFVPAIKRAIRISDEARKQPFLGTDFYVSDFVTPDLNDFNYSFVGEEDVQGHHCKLVESVPKKMEGQLYSKTITAIDPTDLVVLKAQFFDPKGKLLKVLTIDKLEKIDGHWTPLEQTMKNVQEGTSSKLTMRNVKYNADLPEDTFSRSYLTR